MAVMQQLATSSKTEQQTLRITTPFGEWALALTPKGIARLDFFPDKEAATSQPSSEAMPEYTQTIISTLHRYLKGEPVELTDIPIDWERLQGTAFQKEIWQTVWQIPWGDIQTYKDIAERIGNPNASRAVGGAMGQNPIPIIIPCHRVVATGNRPGNFKTGGFMRGFLGGVELKEALLKLEGWDW